MATPTWTTTTATTTPHRHNRPKSQANQALRSPNPRVTPPTHPSGAISSQIMTPLHDLISSKFDLATRSGDTLRIRSFCQASKSVSRTPTLFFINSYRPRRSSSSGNKHCEIEWDGVEHNGGTVVVRDFSSNGTFVSALSISSSGPS